MAAANLLTAQKLIFSAAIPVVPLAVKLGVTVTSENERKAVLNVASIIWFSTRPKLSLPGGAVRPLPDALLIDVATSDPGPIEIFSYQALQDKLHGGIGLDRGQMASLFTAKVFSFGPVLLFAAPEVAMVAFLHPAFGAGFHTFVLAVG